MKNTISHARDLYNKSLFSGRTLFTRFLTPLESDQIYTRFPKGDCSIELFGGYDGAERVIISFGEAQREDYPISLLKVTKKGTKELSHRDFLGTVLSLGIKRELIGDIVLSDDGAYIFALEEIAPFLCDNLTKISNCGVAVTIEDPNDPKIKITREYESISKTVSSLRLDCVVAAACQKSRSAICDLFPKGLVMQNYKEALSPGAPVKDGDVLTVRGFGKFLIQTDGSLTKKGRIHVDIKKYA